MDQISFWWMGIVILIVSFAPYLYLKGGSVFEIHDQLDETLLSYILNARYLGTNIGVFEELLGGINITGMQPSAVIFVPLYRLFPALVAFLIQYAVVFISGYMGMYFSVKRITGSNILATAVASIYCFLPLQPVYGLSCMGVPLLLYAFLCLYDRKNFITAYGSIIFFGLSTHLVLIGYVVLGLWGCFLVYMIYKKLMNFHVLWGCVLLAAVYIGVNYQLIQEFLVGNSGYISHREEAVSSALAFGTCLWDMFFNSGQHAVSLHIYLILPIVGALIIFGIMYKKLDIAAQSRYKIALLGFVGLIIIAILVAFLKSNVVIGWKNLQEGFFRYFQAERIYWLYPAGWYLEFAVVFSVWFGGINRWNADEQNSGKKSVVYRLVKSPVIKLVCLILVLLPTILLIKVNSYFYMNVNQINNGSGITGYITWESYYSEELMEQLEEVIGRDVSTYRIAHLGISPMPALMHGFYTVDGYSNNYPLEYKHKFRKVIAAELDKNGEAASYFDTWGSRCYLFNSQTGTYYLLSKKSNVTYEGLEFDMQALKELGCEYIFSGGEIIDAGRMGLELMGYYETDTSYWGIWLYELVK